MRQIDNMTAGEIETLHLKGMLSEPMSKAEREHRQRMIDHAKSKEKEDYQPAPDEERDFYINESTSFPKEDEYDCPTCGADPFDSECACQENE